MSGRTELREYDGYFSMGLVGYLVAIESDNEHVVYRYTMDGEKEHRAKVYYTTNGCPYFLANGRRIHLDECLRTRI